MKEEKLVEEIARIIDPDTTVWECEGDCLGCETARGNARNGAKRAITLIGKAYADGLEIPGEAWRAQAWVERGRDDYYKNLEQVPRVEVRPPIGALENIPEGWAFEVIAFHGEREVK